MPRGFKVDIQASVERFGTAGRRNGRWRSGFSFVSQPKQIGEHGGPHLILYGEDKGPIRAEIFRRNREANGGVNRCWKCGAEVLESVTYESTVHYLGEWDHIRNKPGERCDCPENGRVACRRCHSERHPKPFQPDPKVLEARLHDSDIMYGEPLDIGDGYSVSMHSPNCRYCARKKESA